MLNKILNFGRDNVPPAGWPYCIIIAREEGIDDVIQDINIWLNNLQDGTFKWGDASNNKVTYLLLKNEDDAIAFRLKFGSTYGISP